ncbi:MAG: aldo/keto reductase [Acidobacteria bacterium]|nr:aldo/keto reductase [Acidobacteriota bacterium]
MTTTPVPTLAFHDGHTIPQLGFGLYRVAPDEAERIVSDALEVGYRHIDTAALYGNEVGVGRAIAASGIPRDELFITTKLWNSDQGTQSAFDAIDLSLEKLGLESVNLYLIHWPVPSRDLFVETWKALEQIQADGKSTSIGVSNFRLSDLDRVLAETDTVPVLNQIELHPLFTQLPLREYGAAHGILTESWGPLGHAQVNIFDEGPVAAAAAAHGVSPAQAIIRWHLQNGLVVIPKSNSRERMAQNFDVFGFELSDAEVSAISALNRDHRSGGHPDEVGA